MVMAFDSDEYEEVLPINAKEDILCCCSKDVAHDEHMKFMLLAAEDKKNATIFSKRQQGPLI